MQMKRMATNYKCNNSNNEIICDDVKCFYHDYYKFITSVQHMVLYNGWGVSIGELRNMKDNISSLLNRTIVLNNDNKVYDDNKTNKNIKYYNWLTDVQYILCNLDLYITEWMRVIDKIHNIMDEFVEQNECPFFESFTDTSPWE